MKQITVGRGNSHFHNNNHKIRQIQKFQSFKKNWFQFQTQMHLTLYNV